MKEADDIFTVFADFDIRAETLAATLLAYGDDSKEGFTLEQTILAPLGSMARRAGNDVAGVRKKYYDHETALLIEVNRKGLFDTLPPQLFLRTDEEYDTPKDRTKAFTQQIKDARKFFLPYEQAMFLPRIEAEQLEQKYTESFPDFVNELWGLPDFADCLSQRQQFLLCYLLPEAGRVVGNWDLTGLCLEAMLQKPIDLRFSAPLKLDMPETNLTNESISLGTDAILGNSFQDDIPVLEVYIKGITNQDLPDYLPTGKRRRLLEELLYSYFIPIDVPVITHIVVTDDAMDFTLGKVILGYNTKFN